MNIKKPTYYFSMKGRKHFVKFLKMQISSGVYKRGIGTAPTDPNLKTLKKCSKIEKHTRRYVNSAIIADSLFQGPSSKGLSYQTLGTKSLLIHTFNEHIL